MAVMTFRHAKPWGKGDNFFFIDVSNPDNYNRGGNLYMEWGPRLSLGKIFKDQPIQFGIIKDFYLVGELNHVHNPHVVKTIPLYGISVDLDIPGFSMFKLNMVKRDDPHLKGKSEQMSMIWNYPFKLFGNSFLFEGFMDIVSNEGATPASLHTQPQLVWKPMQKLNVGIEYQYWSNKNGRKGFTESVLQGMVRWNF